MSRPLVHLPEVREDLDEAFGWYERQRTGLGDEFLDEVRATLDKVQEEPGHHGFVHRDVRAALVRRFPYVVYYRVEVERIVVIAIQHGHRHSRRWRSRT